MDWYSQLTEIENDLVANKILLSSALLRTASAVRNAASDDVMFWLHKEIIGYEQFELDWFVKTGFKHVVNPRTVACVHGVELSNGSFVEKGIKTITLGCSIPELEAVLDQFFDISVLELGDVKLVKSVIDDSACETSHLMARIPETGVAYCVKGSGFVETYFRICKSLLEVIKVLKNNWFGPGPNSHLRPA